MNPARNQMLLGSSEGNVHDQVSQYWEWILDRFPFPINQLSCPQCGSEEIQLSNISYSIREDSKHPYRAEPSYKCRRCSFFWTHGIVCPEHVYRNAVGPVKQHTFRWREVRDILENYEEGEE